MTTTDDIDAILTAAGVPAGGCVWLTYDPDDGWEQYDTEREARDALDCIVDHLRDDSSEGWHEEAEQAALYRCERVASLVLTTTATSDDDTEDGGRCRSNGWDFIARGDIVEHGSTIARLVAERDAARARLARVVPVIEALDAWIVFGAKPTTREAALWLRMVDALAASLGLSDDDDYDTVRAAIRALIADEVPRG